LNYWRQHKQTLADWLALNWFFILACAMLGIVAGLIFATAV
jgi:hypothetical protein